MGVRVPPFAPAFARQHAPRATARRAHPTRRLSRRCGAAAAADHPAAGRSAPMKTEFVDVNETRKTVRVEIPSDVVDAEIDRIARDYSRKARVPGFRPGKTPAARHQAALQGSDPARRRARSDSARGRRCAAREGAGGGRHARRARSDHRRGTAADLHRVVRHRAGVRSGRSGRHHLHACVERDQRRSASSWRCSGCAIAARGTSRSRAAASITATP